MVGEVTRVDRPMQSFIFSEAGETRAVVNGLEAKNWTKRQETPNLILVHVLCTRHLSNYVSFDTHLQNKILWTPGSSCVHNALYFSYASATDGWGKACRKQLAILKTGNLCTSCIPAL